MNNDTEELRIAKTLILQLLDALPQRRDWLDPDIETRMRELVKPTSPTEVEVWVHGDGTIVGPATINREHMEEGGYTLHRATIHPADS